MRILVLLFCVVSFPTFSQEKKVTKDGAEKFTKKEFDKALEKALLEKMKRFRPANMEKLSRELWQKEKALDMKEVKLERREEQVSLNEKALEKRIKDFQIQQNKILGCIDKNDGDKKKRVGHMVDVVSGMRPVNAAEVLSVQDEEISVRILELLPAEKVSKIFNLMDKEVSARLQKQFMSMKK